MELESWEDEACLAGVVDGGKRRREEEAREALGRWEEGEEGKMPDIPGEAGSGSCEKDDEPAGGELGAEAEGSVGRVRIECEDRARSHGAIAAADKSSEKTR